MVFDVGFGLVVVVVVEGYVVLFDWVDVEVVGWVGEVY